MELKEKKILAKIPQRITNADVLTLIQQNEVTPHYIQAIKAVTTLSDDIISELLNISVKTFRSYKQPQSKVKLKEDIQEHTVMLLALMKHGIDVFGNKEHFDLWLQTTNPFFGNKKPVQYLNTISGIRYTDDRLTGMEYGDNA